ncbi:disease resistance protein RPV1-like [Pyrus x bretschneideri]|uniref:disease resistance protein RPV1-like n=1 Tax=Pyrus x bretschneideri TaxID=225117 RepID=UPI00202F2F31|nr:disease resistance protein RPV1-like [Pyrus x bretschneideri]
MPTKQCVRNQWDKAAYNLKVFQVASPNSSPLDVLLSRCKNLEKFPEISVAMKQPSELYMDETAIEELPTSIKHLPGLETLSLKGCSKLKILPCNGTAIMELPSSIDLSGLSTLKLNGCLGLQGLPSSICQLKSLRDVSLSGCSSFEKFPEISKVTEGRQSLNLEGCRGLKSLPCSIWELKCLRDVNLSRCSNFQKFPEISMVVKGLSSLCLDETAIEELPSSIKHLTGLSTLNLRVSRDIRSYEGAYVPSLDRTAIRELASSIENLRSVSLNLKDCRELKSLLSSICQLKSLKYGTLSGCPKLEVLPISKYSEVMKESNQCSTKYVTATKFGQLVVASDLIFYQPVDGVVVDGVNVLLIPLGLDCLFLGKFGCSCLRGYGDGLL